MSRPDPHFAGSYPHGHGSLRDDTECTMTIILIASIRNREVKLLLPSAELKDDRWSRVESDSGYGKGDSTIYSVTPKRIPGLSSRSPSARSHLGKPIANPQAPATQPTAGKQFHQLQHEHYPLLAKG